MVAFQLEVILLLAVAFVCGAAIGAVLRRRRRTASGMSALVESTLLAPGEAARLREGSAAEAVGPDAAPSPTEPASAMMGEKPPVLDAPGAGGADDLTVLRGIGPQADQQLKALGIFHLAQIADWTPEQAHWIGIHLGFPGRVEREDWVGQSRAFVASAGRTTRDDGTLYADVSFEPPKDDPSPRHR